MESVIYEDSPHYDVWLKGIMMLPIFFILIGLYYLFTGQVESGIGLFATAVIMGAIYWAIFPRKYQVLDSKLRIVLGGPFSFNIRFDTLENACKPEGVNFGINFATTFISEHILEIKRKKGLTVNITPNDRDLFLENLNKAVYDWRRNNIKGR
ncbi:MAG: hypothetical protein MUO97_00060 [Dehalococcoidia bacterium]|nr:hypothetical protein [Dehalococcoidia bacterium]